jgi:hypothetical protein
LQNTIAQHKRQTPRILWANNQLLCQVTDKPEATVVNRLISSTILTWFSDPLLRIVIVLFARKSTWDDNPVYKIWQVDIHSRIIERDSFKGWSRPSCKSDSGLRCFACSQRTSQNMNPMNAPLLVLALSFVLLFLAAYIGDFFRNRVIPLKEDVRNDFGVVLGAMLTLLGLLIGFSFSMAVSRYDQRKNYEEAEANAIGTEYLRADLLSARDAVRVRELLKEYLDERVLFYTTRNQQRLAKINADTAALQNQLWSAVLPGAAAQPTPPLALVVSGMNDVLNSQGYTQAAWWNRIPIAAWVLMAAIAACGNLLIGYGAHRTERRLFLIVPVAVSIAFFLISDIDSPRGGSIRVAPQNLLSLSQSLRTQ